MLGLKLEAAFLAGHNRLDCRQPVNRPRPWRKDDRATALERLPAVCFAGQTESHGPKFLVIESVDDERACRVQGEWFKFDVSLPRDRHPGRKLHRRASPI